MKVLGIIPARYNSSRFPGKPLVDIAGKSMIQRVVEQAAKSELIHEVVVATDDQRIFDHVQSFGGKVFMTAEHHRNGTERCGEVVEHYSDFDIVINIQGDEPLIQPEQLEKVIALFEDTDVQIGSLCKKLTNPEDLFNPNRIKVVKNTKQDAMYFSRGAIPFQKDQKVSAWLEKADYFKHIGIYAWRAQCLKQLLQLPVSQLEQLESLEQLRWLDAGYKIRLAETDIETPNIDTPEDLESVLKVING
ncbi:MAG: 3-deoxy-manno-octulosonate cytidylyltransferase [Crocinitomicaceae bacterium]